jgi:hypothetical protein
VKGDSCFWEKNAGIYYKNAANYQHMTEVKVENRGYPTTIYHTKNLKRKALRRIRGKVHGTDSYSKGNDNNEEKQPLSLRDGVNVEMLYSYLFICWSWAYWLSPIFFLCSSTVTCT